MPQEPGTTEQIHPFNDEGRMILAAVITGMLDNTSVDYTMRTYVPEIVHPDWAILAEKLIQDMQLRMQKGWTYAGGTRE